MKAFSRTLLLAGTTFLVAANLAFAQTQSHEGSRAGAMGGAFLAISNDVSALAFNPAGLVYAPQAWMAEFSLQNPFASGVPFREGLRNEGVLTASSFGVVHHHLRHTNQTQPMLVLGDANWPALAPATTNPPTSSVYALGFAGSIFNSGGVNEIALRASFSKGFFEKDKANAATNHFAPLLALSAMMKVLGLQYDARLWQNAEVNSEEERIAITEFFAQNRHSAWGLGLDLGMMFELHPRVRAALSWNNLLAPDLALRTSAPLARSLRGGIAILLHEQRQWWFALDYEHSAAFPQNRFYLGMESGVLKISPNLLRARVGVNRNWLATGFMLAKPGLVELHYAFLWPTIFSDDRPEGFFQHRFSVALAKGR